MRQSHLLFVCLIQLLISMQRRLHLLVARQIAGFRRTGLTGGFALGQRVIVDAVFGHETCWDMGHTQAKLPTGRVISRHVDQEGLVELVAYFLVGFRRFGAEQEACTGFRWNIFVIEILDDLV